MMTEVRSPIPNRTQKRASDLPVDLECGTKSQTRRKTMKVKLCRFIIPTVVLILFLAIGVNSRAQSTTL